MDGVRTVNATMAAFLHPSRAADVLQGVHEILNSLLLRFNEVFEGVILAYLAPKTLRHTAKILSGLYPYFHLNLTVKLLLFSPCPGMKIEGKVNKIEKDYIGVLVLGLFNTTVGVVDIRDDLNYSAAHHSGRAWVSNADTGHLIELGSLIRFSVKSLQETEHIIDICGSLMEDTTGCVSWLEQNSARLESNGSKEAKLRSIDNEGRQRMKPSKKRRQSDVPELRKGPQDLNQNNVSQMNEKVKAGIGDPLVLAKHNMRKEIDLDVSKRRKGKSTGFNFLEH